MNNLGGIILGLLVASFGGWYISKSLTDADRRAAAERSVSALKGEGRAERQKAGLRPVRTVLDHRNKSDDDPKTSKCRLVW